MTKPWTSLYLLLAAVAIFTLTSCGDNGEESDTLWTGLSGVLIFGVLVVIAIRFYNKRKRS